MPRTDLTDVYSDVKQLHTDLYERIKYENEHLENLELSDAADQCYMLTQCAERLKSLSIEMEKLRKNLGGAAIIMARESGTMHVPTGKLARAHIKGTVSAKIPSYSKDPEGYQRLCRALGVPFHPDTRLHYPTLKEKMSAIMDEKGELPDELKPFAVYEEVQLVCVALSGPDSADKAISGVPDYARR